MDKSRREWLISIFCLILILFASANQSFACPPPYCGDCQKWDPNSGTSGACVDDDDQDTTGGDTEEDANDVCGYCQKCSDGSCVNDDEGGNSDDVCVGPGTECDICQSGECEDSCPTGCCGGECCEAPVITSISGPDTVEICEEADFSHSSNDPDGTDLTYSWSGGEDPKSGTSSDFTTKWACKGDETVSLTVTDDDNTGCCGSKECCEDKTDSDSVDIEVILPTGCELAGTHDSSLQWINPDDDYHSFTCAPFGKYNVWVATYDVDFKYDDCGWVCEISNVEAKTQVLVRDPLSLPDKVSVESASDVPCDEAEFAKCDLDDTDLTDDEGAPRDTYWCYTATVAHEEKHIADWKTFYEGELAISIACSELCDSDIDCGDPDTITCQAAENHWSAWITTYFALAALEAWQAYDDPATELLESEQRAYAINYEFEHPISAALPEGCTP